jgi:hypothetical protein
MDRGNYPSVLQVISEMVRREPSMLCAGQETVRHKIPTIWKIMFKSRTVLASESTTHSDQEGRLT